MTLQEAKTLHAYNSWANNRMFNVVEKLPDDQYQQDLKSSHGSIHKTLVHMVGAEKVWVERFNGNPQAFLKAEEISSAAELYRVWEKAGYETAKWLAAMSDQKLNTSFEMKNLRGETFTHIYGQAFQHLINHSSYHRGAVVTMLRQLGAEAISTDLIQFYREMKSKP